MLSSWQLSQPCHPERSEDPENAGSTFVLASFLAVKRTSKKAEESEYRSKV